MEIDTADKLCQTYLVSNGCKSLGLNIFEVSKKLLITSIIIIWLEIWIEQQKTQNMNNKQIEDAKNKAENWLAEMENEYPLLSHILELGSTWRKFAQEFVKTGCQ